MRQKEREGWWRFDEEIGTWKEEGISYEQDEKKPWGFGSGSESSELSKERRNEINKMSYDNVFPFCFCLNQALILPTNNVPMRRFTFQLYTLNYRHKHEVVVVFLVGLHHCWSVALGDYFSVSTHQRNQWFFYTTSLLPHFNFQFNIKLYSCFSQILSYILCKNNLKCVIQLVQPDG